MADFIYYPESYTGTNKCFRINNPKDSKVWSRTDGAMFASSEVAAGDPTQVETAIELAWDAGLRGYPVVIPSSLPAGEYDLLIFDVLYSASAATDTLETGFGFKWTGKSMLTAPKELLVNRVG
jgi:hypothetical protein